MSTVEKVIRDRLGSGFHELPGEFPFKRGIYPEMYARKLWTVRQYSGFASAGEANARFKELISQGATGLSIAFDLPSQMGLDPDHKLARGEVGRVGVSIACLEDMRELLSDLPLKKLSISMTINATAVILLGMLIIVAEEKGLAKEEIRGTIQNDILKEHIARGTQFLSLESGLRLVTDLIEYSSEYLRKLHPISISGYHIREAGSTLVDELAFSFSNAIVYLEEAKKRNLDLESLVDKFSFFYAVNNNFLEEIAKFRAARCVWARLLRKRFGISDESKCKLKFHAQTAGSTLSPVEPLNNISRTSLQALAAVLGGCQSLHVCGFDEAYGLPSEESIKQSLATQKILAEETGLTSVADPLGGSYYIEELTEKMVQQVEARITEIDDCGGMLSAIEKSLPQDAISEAAYRYQKTQETFHSSNPTRQVSTNKPINSQQLKPYILNPNFEEERIKNFSSAMKKRNQSNLDSALIELSRALDLGKNSVPLVMEALKVGASLGEISAVFLSSAT